MDLREAFKKWDRKNLGGLDETEFQVGIDFDICIQLLRLLHRHNIIASVALLGSVHVLRQGALSSLGFDASPEMVSAVFKAQSVAMFFKARFLPLVVMASNLRTMASNLLAN